MRCAAGTLSKTPYRLLLHNLLVCLDCECTAVSLRKSLRSAWCRLQRTERSRLPALVKRKTRRVQLAQRSLFGSRCGRSKYATHHVKSSHAIVRLDGRLSLKTQGLHPAVPAKAVASAVKPSPLRSAIPFTIFNRKRCVWSRAYARLQFCGLDDVVQVAVGRSKLRHGPFLWVFERPPTSLYSRY